MTPVIFRAEKRSSENEITAVFPTIEANPGYMVCYAHIGQHGECGQGWYYTTRPAKPDEYSDLLAELIGLGYDDLKVYKRMPSHRR